MTRPGDETLPRYDWPPVSEVVISVQFDPITALTPVHLGAWWTTERRAKYPLCEEHAPLAPQREEFGSSVEPTFNLRLSGAPPTPAIWFLAADRSELLQVQRDRFTRNWTRESAEAAPYPSYSTLMPKFLDDFKDFSEFLRSSSLPEPSVVQCEMTYLNPLPATPGYWETCGDVEHIIAPWSGEYSDGFLRKPEDMQLAVRFVIPADDGTPLGRLYVSLQPAARDDNTPAYLLNLTARGRPVQAGLNGITGLLEIAHAWIVRGFTTFTSQKMHQLWGRSQ